MSRRKSEAELKRELDEVKRQYEARIRDAHAREATAARKARNHALMTIGGMVESHLPNGWESIDWAALDDYLDRYAQSIRRCTHEPLSTEEATRELREWERTRREQRATVTAAIDQESGRN